MSTEADKVLRITPDSPRNVKVSYVLHKVKGIQERVVRIDEWFQWGIGYLKSDESLKLHNNYADCDVDLGYSLEDSVAISYTFDGEGWTDKDRHRVQKDYSRGSIDRIIESDPDWYIKSTQLLINAPFRLELVDPPQHTQGFVRHIRSGKKQLLTKKEYL